MNKYVVSIIKSATLKDSMVLMIGSVITAGLGFLLVMILTRYLNPSQLGLFLTALTFTQLVTDFFELGVNTTIFSYLPGSRESERLEIIKSTFLMKLLIGILITVIIVLFSPFIAIIVFNNQDMELLLRYSTIGIVLMSFLMWGQTVFQSQTKFVYSALTGVSINLLRCLAIVVLIFLGFFNLNNAYFFSNTILLIAVAAVFIVLKLPLSNVKVNLEYVKKIFTFGLPAAAAFALSAVYTKLDQMFVFNMVGSSEAGIYGVSTRLASAFILASSALFAAVTPRFASLSAEEFGPYFKKSFALGVALAFVVLSFIPLAPVFLPLLFGQDFAASVIPFQILSVGIVFFILQSPFYLAVLYRFKKSKFALILSIISLLLTWILLNIFIPKYQSSGAALAISCVYFIQLVVIAGYYLKLDFKYK